MGHPDGGTDVGRVTLRTTLAPVALAATALVVATLVGASKAANAGSRACLADGAGNGGYTYAGHQATRRGHGVRATISAFRAPEVAAGHVAGWVGLGGPGQGAKGENLWIQAGLGSMPGMGTFVYGEVVRSGREPQFLLLEEDVPVGSSRRLAILEMSKRPERWRIWVDGKPVTKPIHLPGSSERWAPIATAESWNGGEAACNSFAFRFERVSVSHGRGGSWFPFKPGYRFRDADYRLRQLAAAPSSRRARSLADGAGATGRPAPYAFVASSR
jgi:hypothetical protein